MPKPARQFSDQIADARLLATRLLGLSCVLSLAVVALAVITYRAEARAATVKPILIQVDELGRHAVLDQDLTITQNERERVIKWGIKTFVLQYFSRRHGVAANAFAQARWFLEPSFGDALYRKEDPEVIKFLNNPSAEDIDIDVKNVSLSDVTKTAGKALVAYEKTFAQPRTHEPKKKPETYVLNLDFTINPDVPAAYVPVNPLGLQVTYFRVDQAFQ